MGKFILLLLLIFVAFYIGGSVLFDSGIMGRSARIPVAVETERIFRMTQGFAKGLGTQLFGVVSKHLKF